MPDNAADVNRTGAGATDAGAPLYPAKGFRLGEYTLQDPLGHGSMATVFLAQDATAHEVAIKIFQEGPGVSPTMLERFRREAEAAKKLRKHPNIMKVYATGKEGPYHFIVMEPIRNSRTLEDLMETSPLTPEAAVKMGIKIAHALHYAHTRNIVHRDVKPSNIMIDEFGEPLLSDFGVAALIDWPSCTMSGALTGTPLYMSPEQSRAERVGPASDVYSLGVVLYEALTGVLPYSTQHSAPVKNVLEAVKNEQPRRLRFHRRDISPDLEAVILKALEKNPDDRYPDAEAMASDLDRVLAGRHVSAQLFSYAERLWFLMRRYDQFVAAAVVMVIMAAGAGLLFRAKLLTARYEKLISIVHLRNLAAKLSSTGGDEGDSNLLPGAWHEIRLGRRAMSIGDWPSAATELQTAIDLSRRLGDERSAAIAELDLARTETLLSHPDQALQLYRSILDNRDAPASVTSLAQLESLLLTLYRNDRTSALQILGAHELPESGPVREAIHCLAGEIDTQTLLARTDLMAPRLQNDVRLAAAVRYRMDGDERDFVGELKRCLAASAPPSEWPAPLARVMLAGVRN